MNRSPLRLLCHLRHLRRILQRTLASWSGRVASQSPGGPGSSALGNGNPTDEGQLPPPTGQPAGTDPTHPSLNLAFQQVGRSYAEIAARLDASHSRLNAIQSVVLTLTLAVPTVALAVEADTDFASVWLIAAGVVALVNVIVGIEARILSGMKLVNPAHLYDGWLHIPEEEFKRRSVYWAGRHFTANSRTVYRTGWVATGMVVLLLVEVGLFVAWFGST